jgi:hypothetical protein
MNQIVTEPIREFPSLRRLTWTLCALFASLLSITLMPQSVFAFDHSHKLWTAELRKYIKPDGVLYARWKEHRQGLDKYLESLSELTEDDYKTFDVQQKEALWLNAYNALTIKLVLDHYPISGSNPEFPSDSIRQIPNTWDAVSGKIAGRDVTLYTIAHDILRRDRDCRTHFAIVPASRGAGMMQTEAYQPRDIEVELSEDTRSYLSRPENLSCNVEKGTLTVSQIFKWFPLDFLGCTGDGRIPMPPPQDDDVVRDYVTQFLPRELKAKVQGKNFKVIYAPYDWTLNDASAPESATGLH